MKNPVEILISGLSLVRNPLGAALFGVKAVDGTYDPEVAQREIRTAERRAYGPQGLARFEKEAGSELARLARRSLAQYFAQESRIQNRWVAWIRSGGILLSLPLLFLCLVAGGLRRRGKEPCPADVAVLGHYDEFRKVVVPLFRGLRVAYCTHMQPWLGAAELAFLIRAIVVCPRVVLHPRLVLNLLRWLSYYAYVVRLHGPKKIVSFFEAVCSSSLITAYLRERAVEHINHMHGERFPSAGISFCEFDEFDVWGRHFQEMFESQRCTARRFRITGNPYHRELFKEKRRIDQPRPKHLLIVHNQTLTPGSLPHTVLAELLSTLDGSWDVWFRLHYRERASGLACLAQLRQEESLASGRVCIRLQEPSETRLSDALVASRVVVGLTSTAMVDAWVAGCKIIHLAGDIDRDVVMNRYGGSRNAIFARGDCEEIRAFLSHPAAIDEREDELVDYMTAVRAGTSV